jgi:transcriptional regulator with XRE-family HTH domain
LKTLTSPDHIRMREMLLAARIKAGLTQKQLAERLDKPQSFVSKYETGERLLDVIELIWIARELEFDPARTVRELAANYGKK